jgi:hypothetical protein
MELINQIGLEVVEILTLVFGILGITFSFLLLFSPSLTKSISKVFNRYVNIDKKINCLDKDVRIDSFIYHHNLLFGTFLIAGSIFSLIFFFFRLDVSNFANIFFVSPKYLSINEMIFSSASWIGRVACFFGLVFGTILALAPHKMRQVGNKLNFWFDTRSMFDKLDNPNRELDTILFKHPVIFGLTGLIISFVTIILSLLNLMG